MPVKKFDINSLNAVGGAIDDVNKAFQQPVSPNETPSETKPVSESETSSEASPVSQNETTSETVPGDTARSEKPKKSAKAKKAEEIKMVGVQIPMSLFKKLTLLKLETGTPVRQICLEMIEEGVKNYKK